MQQVVYLNTVYYHKASLANISLFTVLKTVDMSTRLLCFVSNFHIVKLSSSSNLLILFIRYVL